MTLHYSTHCRQHKKWTPYLRAKITAETKATAHAFRFRHRVDVYETNLETLTSRIIESIDPEKTEKNRLFDVDAPPF